MRITTLSSFGVVWTVAVDDRVSHSEVLKVSPPGTVESTASPLHSVRLACVESEVLLSVDGQVAEVCDTPADAVEAYRDSVHRLVAERSPFAFLHAGAIAREGQAVLFPGRSGAGKTTLVADLCSAGWEYLSDDYAPLDEHGEVHPYPRDLGVRTWQGRSWRSPSDLGYTVGAGPTPVAGICLLEFESGSSLRPSPLESGVAFLATIEHAVSIRERPEGVMTAVANMVDGAWAVAGRFGSGGQVLDWLNSQPPFAGL